MLTKISILCNFGLITLLTINDFRSFWCIRGFKLVGTMCSFVSMLGCIFIYLILARHASALAFSFPNPERRSLLQSLPMTTTRALPWYRQFHCSIKIKFIGNNTKCYCTSIFTLAFVLTTDNFIFYRIFYFINLIGQIFVR